MSANNIICLHSSMTATEHHNIPGIFCLLVVPRLIVPKKTWVCCIMYITYIKIVNN